MEYGRLDHNKVGQEAEESQSGAISAEEEGQHGFYILHYLIHKIRSGIMPTSNRHCTIYIIYMIYSVYFNTHIFPDSVTDKASR